MSKYALITNGEIRGIVDLDDAWYQSLVNTNNPKAASYCPIIEGQQQDYDSETEVISDAYSIVNGTVVKSWTVRAKTQEEIVQETNRTYTAYEFLLRFTAEERAAFRAAAINDTNVADFMQLAQAAQEIHTTDAMTVAGMNYLVLVGLLTTDRKNAILS